LNLGTKWLLDTWLWMRWDNQNTLLQAAPSQHTLSFRLCLVHR
jgi:hypothetical protein